MTGTMIMWVRGLALMAVLVTIQGCELPYPGPYQGTVTDSDTDRPISGAKVEAEWWCHDNPMPDLPGSFFVRSSTITDERGSFRLRKETRRGGLFGSSFVLKVSAKGYIPVNLLPVSPREPLPPNLEDYPFIRTVGFDKSQKQLDVKLSPAVPVLLKAMKSGIPLHQKVAREQLTKLLGVDLKYDVGKWEQAIESGAERVGEGESAVSSEDKGCPCPDAADRSGQPREVRRKVRALVKAAALGEMNKVKTFLDNGMDPNSQNYACRTPLLKAAFNGHVKLVEFLLSKGADVNAKDDNCRTALMSAASLYGSSDMVETLLAHRAHVNARDKGGMTALMLAATFGNEDTVRILLSHGAEVNIKDNQGETAWFKAAVVSRKDVMRLLESAGATH